MFALQIGLLVCGVVGGLVLAHRLRRRPLDPESRSRVVVAFGAGALAWVGFAAIALPAPFAWFFLGTVLALYVPPLLVIASAGAARSESDPATR
jgi:hypothetical protein